jgi:16S rRNA (guanine527-N7)-methyltransferase
MDVSKNFPLFGGKRLKPGLPGLKTLLNYHGVDLNHATLEKLWLYHQLIRNNNEDQDLTRLNAFETMVERHYADCIIPNAFVKKWPSKMIDVGSGAGFPGIPLKLVNPEIDLTLCEPRPNRVRFLELVIKELKLDGIQVFGHKVTSKSMTMPVTGVISRAFESINSTIPRIAAALEPGGQVYFMKGPAIKDELQTLDLPVDFHLEHVEYYEIPNSKQKRALVIVRRD